MLNDSSGYFIIYSRSCIDSLSHFYAKKNILSHRYVNIITVLLNVLQSISKLTVATNIGKWGIVSVICVSIYLWQYTSKYVPHVYYMCNTPVMYM